MLRRRFGRRQSLSDKGETFPDTVIYNVSVKSVKSNTLTSKRPTTSAAMIRVGAFRHIPEVLKDLGANPADVCAAAGLDVRLFDDPTNLITFHAASHLFRVCTDRTGCLHFGLLNGQKSGLDALGLIGALARCSPDAGAALHSIVRFMHLHIRGAVATVEKGGTLAMFSYEIYEPRAEATDQINDAALGTMFNIMLALCGPHWKPIEVRFEHRRPPDLAPFHRFFQVPLRFGSDSNSLVFAANWLSHPLPAVEPELDRLLRNQIEALEAHHADDFPETVRSILRTALLADQGSADQVATLLSMHSRTLHRRLVASGTNFRGLVDECRYEIARQMLEDTDSDVGQVAYVLGYADTSAFARAFRRWSGTTPSRWRMRDQRPSPSD
jgi:AraC-like DNA-binding protein